MTGCTFLKDKELSKNNVLGSDKSFFPLHFLSRKRKLYNKEKDSSGKTRRNSVFDENISRMNMAIKLTCCVAKLRNT